MTITLGPDLEAALNELARRQGISPEAVIASVVREQFAVTVPFDEARDEWERLVRGTGTDCGVSLSDTALSSEGLYD